MNVPVVHEYGPYTLYDLDALPEDGKRYELADGQALTASQPIAVSFDPGSLTELD